MRCRKVLCAFLNREIKSSNGKRECYFAKCLKKAPGCPSMLGSFTVISIFRQFKSMSTLKQSVDCSSCAILMEDLPYFFHFFFFNDHTCTILLIVICFFIK